MARVTCSEHDNAHTATGTAAPQQDAYSGEGAWPQPLHWGSVPRAPQQALPGALHAQPPQCPAGALLCSTADHTPTCLLTISGKSRFPGMVTAVSGTHASLGPCTCHQGAQSVPLSWVLAGPESMLAAGMVEPTLCPLRLGTEGNSFQWLCASLSDACPWGPAIVGRGLGHLHRSCQLLASEAPRLQAHRADRRFRADSP